VRLGETAEGPDRALLLFRPPDVAELRGGRSPECTRST